MKRAERWAEFDAEMARWAAHPDPAPAFVQEVVRGLWCIQVYHRPQWPVFGRMYRMFCDPPSHLNYQPSYYGWPGDHRGWMRFESKESARDFYKFATGLITFDEFRELPHAPLSDVRIDMDKRGNFIEVA